MGKLTKVTLVAALIGMAGPAVGQAAQQDAASYPAQTAFPREDARGVAKHLSAARRLAEPDLTSEFTWRCLTSSMDRLVVSGVQHNGLVPATKVFDNLYSVGQNAVSAWAIDTREGIILIDSLNNADEARAIIVPNLQRLGLDPKRIRYLIITHGHGDHWGGAKYLQDTYGARVVAAEGDWRMMETPAKDGPFASLVPPRRDIVAKDGDVVTLGGETVRMYVTPGHTPGVLSLIFPVTDHGVTHVAGLMGGSGGGQDGPTVRQQVASLARWGALTRAAQTDVLVTNHSTHMNSTEKMALIRYAMPGDKNPFVYGTARYQRFIAMLGECSRVQLARMGEASD